MIAGIALFFGPQPARAQAPAAHKPFAYDAFQSFRLIAPGVGWAITSEQVSSADCQNCSNEHLFWTQDNGKSWRDITPPHKAQQHIDQVTFLSNSNGWAALRDPHQEDDTVITLTHTSDGGGTWEPLPALSAQALGFMDGTAPGPLFFLDAQHGWMFWGWSAESTRADYLLATADGGRTWRRLPPPPGGGPLQFVSPSEGWLMGVREGPPFGFRGAGRENAQLWLTHDGGRRWLPVAIPLPVVPQSRLPILGFDAMNLKNGLEGTVVLDVPFSEAADTEHRYFTCTTADGGKNWRISPRDSKRSEPSIVGSNVVWFTPRSGTRNFTIADSAAPSTLPSFLWPGGTASASFADDSNGWIRYSARPAATSASVARLKAEENDPLASVATLLGLGQGETELLSTTDGGKTFQVITPPAGNGSASPNPALPPPEIDAIAGAGGAPKAQTNVAPDGTLNITGRAFASENTVELGTRQLMAESTDGEHLRVTLPADLAPGSYQVSVANLFGKSNALQLTVVAAK